MESRPRLHINCIDPHAIGIVNALQKKGFTTFLVGGCVRDLLLGIQPKDYDIATMAKPNEVKRTIHNSYVIGKRFRLVLVKRDEQLIEVATFRRDRCVDDDGRDDLPEGDNIFGSPEEDALRRDFTINGLFYDPINDQLIDYCEGLSDLKAHFVKMIGDPEKRLREDSIRILRGIRLAHKIGFTLEPQLRKAIANCAEELKDSALPRRREEFLKFLRLQDPSMPFLDCHDLGVLKVVGPMMDEALKSQEFLHHLRHIHTKPLDKENPVDLFGGLVHAYVRTFIERDALTTIKADRLLEHPKLQALMKDELGMFKYEQSLVTKAIQMQPLLTRRKEFEKRGVRRQLAVLKNDSFPLALQFCERDFCISAQDLDFWVRSYEINLADIVDSQLKRQKKRRKRPRRRTMRAKPAQDRAQVGTRPKTGR